MDTFHVVLILLAFLSYTSSLIFSYTNVAVVKGLFNNLTAVIDNKYEQHLSPDGIIFAVIWPVIYFWNAVGIIYILVSFCLSERKSPVKMHPTLVPKLFLVGYIFAWATTSGWLFAFDHEILELALALLLLSIASGYVAVGASYKRVYDNVDKLETNSKGALWLTRILVQNGFCLLPTWLTVATLINLADVILYEDSYGMELPIMRGTLSIVNASTVSLSILMALVLAWFILENFVWEKYCRYTFTVYPVLILALSGLVGRLQHIPEANQNLIIASVDLGLAILAFFARIALSLWRFSRKPKPVHTETIKL